MIWASHARHHIDAPSYKAASRHVVDLRFTTALVAGALVVGSLRAETLLLTGATIHPVTSATITNGDVLIQDGKIKGVFDASQPTRAIIPSDAKRIDLKGLHLYP